MRQLCLLAFTASLAACAIGSHTPVYRPYGDQGPAWPIGGDYNSITDDLRIFVNGEPAAAGKLWFSDTPRTVTGSYQGHPVRADCAEYKNAMGGTLMVACDVFIDGTRAALLTLD